MDAFVSNIEPNVWSIMNLFFLFHAEEKENNGIGKCIVCHFPFKTSMEEVCVCTLYDDVKH